MKDTSSIPHTLAYHASLPFHWQALTDKEFESGIEVWQKQNLEIIHNILLFEHLPRELGEEDSETSVQLQHLDLKINLMMELLMQVMAQQQTIPEAQELGISADALAWEGGELPSEQQLILVQIYLCQRYPRPLILPAEVVSASATACKAEFISLNETLLDKLQQLIFLYHRRQIAESRKS